jgi:hypothetical protein
MLRHIGKIVPKISISALFFTGKHLIKSATNRNVAIKGVHLEKWRDEFKRRHAGDNDKSKNTAHQRARKALISLKLVEVNEDIYSLSDKAT